MQPNQILLGQQKRKNLENNKTEPRVSGVYHKDIKDTIDILNRDPQTLLK